VICLVRMKAVRYLQKNNSFYDGKQPIVYYMGCLYILIEEICK